jgi:hypothetical protein
MDSIPRGKIVAKNFKPHSIARNSGIQHNAPSIPECKVATAQLYRLRFRDDGVTAGK